MRKLLLALGVVALAACAGKEKAENAGGMSSMAADSGQMASDSSHMMADSSKGMMKQDTSMARDTSKM